MTQESATPSRTVGSPGGGHTARFPYAGEIRFGPAYYRVELDGRLLRKRLFGKRYFGEACLWSTDSRYLALSEWRSLSEARGPDTQLVVIEIRAQHQCVAGRMRGGFAEPSRFEGSTLVYARTWFDKEVRADVATDAVEGRVLEVATGVPQRIIVVVKDAYGGTRLTVGYVYSWFEFPSQKRWSDLEWKTIIYAKDESAKKQNGIEAPSWYSQFLKNSSGAH